MSPIGREQPNSQKKNENSRIFFKQVTNTVENSQVAITDRFSWALIKKNLPNLFIYIYICIYMYIYIYIYIWYEEQQTQL